MNKLLYKFADYDNVKGNYVQAVSGPSPCFYKYRNKVGRKALMPQGWHPNYPTEFAMFELPELKWCGSASNNFQFSSDNELYKLFEANFTLGQDAYLNGQGYRVSVYKNIEGGSFIWAQQPGPASISTVKYR